MISGFRIETPGYSSSMVGVVDTEGIFNTPIKRIELTEAGVMLTMGSKEAEISIIGRDDIRGVVVLDDEELLIEGDSPIRRKGVERATIATGGLMVETEDNMDNGNRYFRVVCLPEPPVPDESEIEQLSSELFNIVARMNELETEDE